VASSPLFSLMCEYCLLFPWRHFYVFYKLSVYIACSFFPCFLTFFLYLYPVITNQYQRRNIGSALALCIIIIIIIIMDLQLPGAVSFRSSTDT
jgi:hypothetical protein